MRIYFSGTPVFDRYMRWENHLIRHRLISVYPSVAPALEWSRRCTEDRPRTVLLDSGAFSAWNSGRPYGIDRVHASYAEFLNTAEQLGVKFDEVWLANLDVIPGRRGVSPTAEEIAEAIRRSDRNQLLLQVEFGNCVIPTFHQGEPPDRLSEVADQSDYIGISPSNDRPEPERVAWAAWAHELVPNHRTHGFATTGMQMMTACDWFSVDSSSWAMMAVYGSIYVPIPGEARWRTIQVSQEMSYKSYGAHHYNALPASERDWIDRLIRHCGFSVPEVMDSNRARSLINLRTMQWFVDCRDPGCRVGTFDPEFYPCQPVE